MSNSSGVVVGILGLIIGAAGLGLAAYSYFTFQANIDGLDNDLKDLEDVVDEISVRGMWYDELLADWKPSAINTNETITGLSISFQVNSGEKVYFLLISRVHSLSATGSNWMIFRFAIDGVIVNTPAQAAGANNQDESGLFVPISLQHSTDSLSSGAHTLTIVALSTKSSVYCRTSTLMVQTYV